VKARPCATTKEEKPNPTFVFQAGFGPLAGHSTCHPVSAETPLRYGPRHCGQSSAIADRPSKNKKRNVRGQFKEAAPFSKADVPMRIRKVFKIVFLPERQTSFRAGCPLPMAAGFALARAGCGPDRRGLHKGWIRLTSDAADWEIFRLNFLWPGREKG
jgi:hypothetical protein